MVIGLLRTKVVGKVILKWMAIIKLGDSSMDVGREYLLDTHSMLAKCVCFPVCQCFRWL